jgi:hypothetical protein
MSLAKADVQRIGQLLDDLKNEDPKKRKNSLCCLREIAKVLGPERTRNELVLFLNGIQMKAKK